jgi:hypothetical protein
MLVVLIQSPQVVIQRVQQLQYSGTVSMNAASTIVLTSGTQNPTVCQEVNHKHSLYIWRRDCDRVSVSVYQQDYLHQ